MQAMPLPVFNYNNNHNDINPDLYNPASTKDEGTELKKNVNGIKT